MQVRVAVVGEGTAKVLRRAPEKLEPAFVPSLVSPNLIGPALGAHR